MGRFGYDSVDCCGGHIVEQKKVRPLFCCDSFSECLLSTFLWFLSGRDSAEWFKRCYNFIEADCMKKQIVYFCV